MDSEDQYRVIKRVCKSMGVDVGKWPARQIQWYINKERTNAEELTKLNPVMITLLNK